MQLKNNALSEKYVIKLNAKNNQIGSLFLIRFVTQKKNSYILTMIKYKKHNLRWFFNRYKILKY